MLQEVDIFDKVLEQRFRVRQSDKFTIVSIGPRDFFFVKETGEFDGTGYSFCDAGNQGIQEECVNA